MGHFDFPVKGTERGERLSNINKHVKVCSMLFMGWLAGCYEPLGQFAWHMSKQTRTTSEVVWPPQK